MSDLFGLGDDTEDIDAAASRDVTEMLDQTQRNPEEPEDIPIGGSDEDDEDDDDDDTREGKKKRRPALMKALQEEREKRGELEQRLARMEGYAQASMQTRHAGAPEQQVDRIQQEIDRSFEEESQLRNEAQAIYDSAAAGRTTVTDDMRAKFDKRHQAITQRRQELTTMKVMRDNNVRPSNPGEGLQAALRAQYSDVYENPKAHQFASATWQRYRALGYPDNTELLKTVMNEARSQFKLGGRPSGGPPSDARRAKYQGTSGGGPDSRGPQKNVVRMTPDMKNIAESHYEHRQDLSSREKHQLWAKEIGPEFLRMERRSS